MNVKQALDEFVSILKDKYGDRIKKVILFGSYARGEADEESDLDVLVVGDVDFNEVIDLTVKIMLKHGVLISVIVEDEEEFEKKKDYSFHRTVLSEGVVIG